MFGYMFAGGALVWIALYPVDVKQLCNKCSAGWIVAAGAVASYVAGHIVVAIGYTLAGWMKLLRPLTRDDMARELYYMRLYPELFVEPDRRDTMMMLRLGLSVAFVAGPVVAFALHRLCWDREWSPCWEGLVALGVVGAFLFYNEFGGEKSGYKHVSELREAAIHAAEWILNGSHPPSSH